MMGLRFIIRYTTIQQNLNVNIMVDYTKVNMPDL